MLNPTYKVKFLEFYFDKLFGDNAADEIEQVHKLCYSLLAEYQSKKHLEQDGADS